MKELHLSDRIEIVSIAWENGNYRLPTKIVNSLRAYGITTVQELSEYPDLIDQPNIGRKSMNWVMRLLQDYGLRPLNTKYSRKQMTQYNQDDLG